MKSLRRRSWKLLQLVALVTLTCSPAYGAPVSWVPDADGFWNVPANWSSNPALPGAADDVTINVAGVRTITHNTGTDTINTLTNAETVLILGGSTLNITSGGTNTGFLIAGGASAGTLNLNGGTLTNTGGVLRADNGGAILQNAMTIVGGNLNTTGTGFIRASNSSSNVLSNVTLGGTLDLATAAAVEQVSGGLTLNSGTININLSSVLTFIGNAGASGTGTIVLGNTGGANRIGLEGAGTTTLGANVVVRGQNGTLGAAVFSGGVHDLINNGRISADVAGGTINLNPTGGTTNNGILEAQNGGTLLLSTNVIGNAGSQIIAGAGSTVLQSAVTLSGVINSSGTGRFAASNSASNVFSGVTLNGTLDLATATGIEQVTGGLTLNGAININLNSILTLIGTQTVGGTGSIVLGNTGVSNRIGLDGLGTTTLGANIVIRGENGTVGQAVFAGGAHDLINNGRISADVAGGTITLNPTGGTTNNGILEAQNGGTLLLSSDVIGNIGGQILSGAGSLVLQSGVTLSGIINTSGTGRFAASNSASNFLNGVTLNGNLDLATATSIERVTGGLTLNGTINVNNNSVLVLDATQTIGGTGSIVLGNTGPSNRIGLDSAGTTTLGANIVIRGENGTVGQAVFVGGVHDLINNGRISADVAGGTITLNPTGGTTNNGILEAQNGGTLVLSSNVIGTAGGQIRSGVGSLVLQNAVTLSGIINTTGTGRFAASNSASNVLSNVTLGGTLDLATAIAIEQVSGGLILNNATININKNSVLTFIGNAGASGTGTIVLGDTGGSNRIGFEGAGTTTLGANVVIRGENGTVGQAVFVGGAHDLINNGRISADVAGGTINLNPSGGTTNNGILEAQNGGTLLLSTNVTGNAGSQIIAGAGSTVLQNAVTLSGIINNSAGTGRFAATNSGSNFLNGVTLGGTLDLATATGIERVIGGLTLNNATINVNNNSILAFQGDQTLGGTGSIALGNTGGSNRIAIDGASTLTVGPNVLIHGQNGTIGQGVFVGGATTLINNGTISADVPGGLITIAANSVTNNGTLRANGGSLTVNAGFTGAGTARIDSTGVLTIGASSTVGTLTHNGSAANGLNLGTRNITVSTSYTNANFGVGNTFNRRANVSGTGQILAAGDVAQAVTGSNIANGTTATPTLTIGNVHVGANTFNYQIANTGSTGPSLIGAIQTSVNGGNITDGRLSGAGVTPSNYGPVATGANTGNLAVTFTVANAGVFAPLSGQAVHIANNFDNVAAQTLSIVSGNGAAAFNLAAGNTTPSPIVFANAHVGDTRTQVLTVTNTAPAGPFTEGLNVSFGANTGNVSNNGGTISLLAGGASNNTSLSATLNTSAAGPRSGSVTVNYVSDGTNTSNLGTTNVGSQTINVSGNVYRLAAPNAIGPINFGNVLVGSSQSRTVSISNLATADGFSEALDAAFGALGGANPGKFSTSGLISLLAAGANNNANMVVTLNTTSAGAFSANVQILLNSNGSGTSGLGITALPTQVINLDGLVQGVVGNLAQAGPHSPEPVVFGNVRVGTVVPTQTLSISNIAAGPAEGLNGSISTATPGLTANGSFTSLAPGATNNSSLVLGMNTTTAGSRNGTATIALVSDGSFNGGTTTPLPSQTVNVQGGVFRLANPVVNTGPVTLAARVGDASPSAGISITNSSPDSFTEGLNVTRGATPAGFTSSGSITNLSAGSTSAGAIQVTLNTAIAGSFSGSQQLAFVSTGAGTTGAPDVSVGSGSVDLTGRVYTPAAAQQNTPSVNFGIVHVGDLVPTQAVSVTNSAPVTALNDVLQAGFSSATNPFTGSGNLGAGLAAQQTDSTSLRVGLNTGSAGIFNGTATFSAASHNADLANLALPNLSVLLSAQVNNFAQAAFTFGSGAGSLSRAGSVFTLDFGTQLQGSGTLLSTLFAGNSALGPADLLDGLFLFLDQLDFAENGFDPFADLAAGEKTGPLLLSFSTAALGSFSDSILLKGIGHNASGFSAPIGDIELRVLGTVIERGSSVPAPATLSLILAGMLVLAGMQIRRRIRAR